MSHFTIQVSTSSRTSGRNKNTVDSFSDVEGKIWNSRILLTEILEKRGPLFSTPFPRVYLVNKITLKKELIRVSNGKIIFYTLGNIQSGIQAKKFFYNK